MLVILGLVGLALFLVLGAFFFGRGIADGGGSSGEASAATDGGASAGGEQGGGSGGGQSGSAEHASATPTGKLAGPVYRGTVDPVAIGTAHASCRAASGVDSAGHRVSYAASNMVDGVPSTAWRCDGEGNGVTLSFSLRHPRRIAQVGLVPGYAKTDPYSGVDRYAQNRRISRVRWSFDGRSWVEQTFRTGRRDRSMQTMRIPPVRARKVTVTIKDSVRGPRDTVAVSGVNLGSPR